MYLKSSQIEKIGDRNFVRIFLEKEYPYKITYNGNEIEVNNFVFEEPNASDVSALQKLSVSMEKLFTYANVIKSLKIMSYINQDRMDELNNSRDEEVETEAVTKKLTPEEKIDTTREFVSSILLKANDFENTETDYYQELGRFFNFVDSKCYREHDDGIPYKSSISLLDIYHAESCFIKEEIVIEYLSFFFAHFPSRSLHATLKR